MKAIILSVTAAAFAATIATAAPVTRTKTVSTPSYEGSRTAVRDKATGTASSNVSVTRKSDGATATRQYDRARTDTGVVASGSTTGFNGKTRSFEYERTRTDSGYTATGTATGRNGQTYTGSGSRTRTETGYVGNRNIVNGDGATVYNRDVAVDRSGGQVSRSVNVTRAQGVRGARAGRR